jgi:hypothetical protein
MQGFPGLGLPGVQPGGSGLFPGIAGPMRGLFPPLPPGMAHHMGGQTHLLPGYGPSVHALTLAERLAGTYYKLPL